ncbi:SusC/RagA family TonB-linked outer membrane protein [Geofilum sp. OHC36d9]|uniref:SusC/RagA family TonB-linked outer membrane protein n=1 Tax=Geofilum sp. OHC36d9 TaxID=3458413 RepID=UPI004034EDBC
MKRRDLILILCLFLGFTTFAQKRVTGVVFDEQEYPVPGVTILEKGTSNGVITDIDGNFAIDVADDASVLVFSFVGMEKQEVSVGTQTNLRVVLSSATSDLDEVVVVGYGVQKKKLTTGATIQVKGEDLQKLNTVNPLGALQSQSPGVNIVQSSGMPGEGFKVNVRGLGTVGNSSPLYVIDGVAGADINVLSPSDIESIDVLKDAASAAIYGARAANGVILVTTKQGKAGKMVVSYDGYYGVQNVYKMPSLLNAKEYMQMLDESAFNNGLSGYDWASYLGGTDEGSLYNKIMNGEWNGTNWLEEIRVKNAATQSHALSITGGSDVSKVSLGFSYTQQEGIFGKPVQTMYERWTARLNSEHIVYKNDAFDVFTVGENLTYSYDSRDGAQQIGNIYGNDIHNMLVASPLMPVYDEDGNYFDLEDKKATGYENYNTNEANPIAYLDLHNGQNLSKNYTLQGNAYFVLQPIKDLKLRSSFGYKYRGESYRSYSPTLELASSGNGLATENGTQQRMSMGFQWQLENTISYVFNTGDNYIDVLIGQSIEKYGLGEDMDVYNAKNSFTGFDYAWLDNTSGTTAGVTSIGGSPWTEGALSSFFGRANWNFKETYMASLIMRADGSSNFASGNRWGYFPSVSAGWVLTNEAFMERFAGAVDFFKLRGSWGQNGNADIDPFQYIATIGFPKEVKYSFGNVKDDQVQGAYQDILASPDISWETSEQINIGLDARFINSRLGLAFDYYVKTTKDWLVLAPILATDGTNPSFINGGDVENKGVELALNWNDQVGDFRYGASLNFAHNKNEVTRIANSEGIIHGETDILSQGTSEMYRAEVGKPIGYFWGFKTAGIFQNQEEIEAYRASSKGVLDNAQPGDVIFVDTDENGVINDDDKVEIGNPNPDLTLGFNLNLGYKGFDFSVTTNGAFGQQVAKSYRSFADSEKQNYTTEIFGRWYGEGTSNKLPRLTPGTHTNWQNISDIYIEDADYVKIQNLTLGYDFKKLFTNMPLSQARLYFSAQNLYTFTNYSGMDPEVGYGNGDDSNWSRGIDLGFYPSPRTYLVGVNLKF